MPSRSSTESRPLTQDAQAQAQAHLHLVEVLARQQYHHCGRKVPLEELLGEAQLGLTYAASLYDASKAVPFGAWVTMVIRHRLVQAVTVWRRGGRLDHIRFTDLSLAPAGEECPVFDPACPRTRDPAEEAANRELLDCVRRMLPPRWFALLHLYFAGEHTLEEIGGQIGVSRERVRQILTRALARARQHCPGEPAEG